MKEITIRRVEQADASLIRAEAVSQALDIITDAQGLTRGCLVDPATGRRLLTCTGCGDLVWLPPSPCVVSVTCDQCSNRCWMCGVAVETLNHEQHDKFGRGLCDWCWEKVDFKYQMDSLSRDHATMTGMYDD